MIKMKYVMPSEDKGIASFICCKKEEPGKISVFYRLPTFSNFAIK